MTTSPPGRGAPARPGSVLEVFLIFLRLGLTSFGGPVAHLGYFREAFVERRQWLGDRAYADLVALCQFLPGPASSQVSMALGLRRAGVSGLLAAWVGFTLPSAIVLVAFAYGVASLGDLSDAGWLLGLKAAAVGVVAHAVLGMTTSLAPDARRATIAVAAMIAVLLIPGALVQAAVIVAAGVVGLIWLRSLPMPGGDTESFVVRVPSWLAISCLVVFGVLLAGLPLLAMLTDDGVIGLADIFYRAGALVFGGGHVVLPLLQADTVETGLVGQDAFLAGYGAAQAVPGPLFTFSAYLGAVTEAGPTGLFGASIALVAIFLPAGLLVMGVVPFWEKLRSAPIAQRALMGINAGVVGLLGAALYTPVFTEGVTSPATFAVAAASFVALASWKVPAWAVVIGAGLLGWALL